MFLLSPNTIIPDLSRHHSLDRSVFLGKRPAERTNAIRNILERRLLLIRKLADLVGGRVLLLVAPLDLEGVELDLGVDAVHVLVVVRGEAAELVDEGHELLDVVPRDDVSALFQGEDCAWVGSLLWHIALLLGGLCVAVVLSDGAGCRAVGLANNRDGVSRRAWSG